MPDSSAYFLGLDAGNTVIKAVIFDGAGRQVAQHAIDGQSSSPEPGHVERDLDELWVNAGTAIQNCIKAAGIKPSSIRGIGCAGHGNGLYLLDRDGAPILGVQSLDTRAAGVASELSAAHGDAFHQLCLQKPWPSQTPTLLAWVKRHRPDIYERAGTALLCKDFLAFRLTGERVSEISDMSGCGLLRLPEGVYDDTLLSLYGLEDARDLLPPLIAPSDIAGRVTKAAAEATGLEPGTPVIGGYFDVVSSALGSGAGLSGDASVIAGTWSINQVFSETPVSDPSIFMVSAFGPDNFVSIEASATSAANLEWYVREFVQRGRHHDDPFGHCNERVGAVSPRLDDPLFHPFLYGSGQGAEFAAGFYGLRGWHGEGHLLRAIFEGVVFEHRRHIGVLKSAGLGFERAFLSGGGARSPHWPQIFADCLGVPISVTDAAESSALGAAIGVALATGHVGSYAEGIAAMTRTAATVEPNADLRAHYNQRFDAYLSLIKSMRGFWTHMQHKETQK